MYRVVSNSLGRSSSPYMIREAFLSPSKRHFDRSCGVVMVLVRYTRAPSMTQTSVSVPPLSMLISRFASAGKCSAIAVCLSSFTSVLNSPEVFSVAFIVDSPSRIAEAHECRAGQISIVNTGITDTHGVPSCDGVNLHQAGHPARLNIEYVIWAHDQYGYAPPFDERHGQGVAEVRMVL